jgi:hypothetical protein
MIAMVREGMQELMRGGGELMRKMREYVKE